MDAFAPLLTELAKTFDVIVLDLPRALASQHPELLAAASTAVVVTDLSLPAMRDALRIKALIRDAAPQSRLKIAVNHHRPLGKSDMPASEFERSIEEKIFCTIPFDPKAAAQAAGAGRPMVAVAKKSKGAEVLHKMSQSLVATKAKKSGFSLGRLFKR
jgi:pilus assembly protein CpaE